MKIHDPSGIKAFGLIVYTVRVNGGEFGSFMHLTNAEARRALVITENELDGYECWIYAHYV